MWPYARDPSAPELSTLAEFVARRHAEAEVLERMQGPYAETFRSTAAFWDLDAGGAPVPRFRVD